MDSKYQHPDDIFKCQQCGACCKGFGGTYLTDQDIINISKFINFDQKEFPSRYCDTYSS